MTEPHVVIIGAGFAGAGAAQKLKDAPVVELPEHGTMTGHAAWLAWLGVHAALLSGGEEKTTTMVDWGWNILTKKRGKRIVVSDEDVAAES